MEFVWYGGCAATVEIFTLYPLDFLKTKMQLLRIHSIGDIIRVTWENSARGFWRGAKIATWTGIPKVGARFAGFNFVKPLVADGKNPAKYCVALCGLGAGISEACVITPFETIKTYMVSERRYTGAYDVFREIKARDGIDGLWRGFRATALRNSINASTRIWSYLWLRYIVGTSSREWPLWKAFLAGGCSSVIAVLCTNWIDVIKTTMQ